MPLTVLRFFEFWKFCGIFGLLPSKICDSEGSLNSFNSEFDNFLAKIPEQPPLRGYTQRAASNSLNEQIAALRAEGVFQN